MDLFWGICSKMKRKGTKEEIFTFKQIKELIDYNINARGDRFANDFGLYQIKRDKTFHLRNSKKLLMVFGNLVIF